MVTSVPASHSAFGVQVSFEIPRGGSLALVGESGSVVRIGHGHGHVYGGAGKTIVTSVMQR